MANRHQRRKRALAKQAERTERLALAAIADRNAKIVRDNMSSPVRPSGSGKMGNRSVYQPSVSHHGHVCRAGGAMEARRALALKAKGNFAKADSLHADTAATLGEALSGRAFREAQEAETLRKIRAIREAKLFGKR